MDTKVQEKMADPTDNRCESASHIYKRADDYHTVINSKKCPWWLSFIYSEQMKIIGFSCYEVEPDGTIYSTKTGKRKLLEGSKRDCMIHLRSDDGRVLNAKKAKVLWCAEHNMNPLDFPKGDYLVSKKHGIVSKADLMRKNNEKMFKAWKKDDAIAELERCKKDNEMQMTYLLTGDMSPLLLRFEEYKPEVNDMLVMQYGMNKDTAKIVIECVFDAFLKNVQSNFPIHSVKAYMVGSAKRHMKAYRKERHQMQSINGLHNL